MECNKNPLNWHDIVYVLKTKEFDSEIDEYYPVLLKELSAVPINTLPNQYIYYNDFYNLKHLFPDNNIFDILGYGAAELVSDDFFYNTVHPADIRWIRTEEACSKKQNCITRLNWWFLPRNMLFCSIM